MSNDEPSREELAKACGTLVRLWHSRRQIMPDRQAADYHDARLHAVSGLAAHAYRTGEVADHMLNDGLSLECAPMVRIAFECAITAQWVAQVRDGVQAVLNEDYRSRRNMAATLEESEAWAASGLEVPTPTDEDHESLSNAQARNFRQMCDDLSPGGAEAYMFYKTLCWFTHPTNYIMDRYTDFQSSNDGAVSMRLRRTPRSDSELAHTLLYWLFTVEGVGVGV